VTVTLKKKLKQKFNSDEEYELSRFRPLLRTVLEDHIANKLDPTVFPYVRDAPPPAPTLGSLRGAPPPGASVTPATSLRSAKPNWHKAARPGGAEVARQRLIVFVAGGATYSELRTAYQVSSSLQKEVIIGSTHMITPQRFLDDLKALDMGGVGSIALPNGLSTSGPRDGEPRPYQDYYNQKYHIKDAPPPPRPAPAPTPSPGQDRGRSLAPSTHSAHHSPALSTASSRGQDMFPDNTYKKEKKEKKRGLFHF